MVEQGDFAVPLPSATAVLAHLFLASDQRTNTYCPEAAMTATTLRVGMALVALATLAAGCGSSGAGTTSAAPRPSGAAAATEINPAGDIPDNQAFVPYRGAGFTVSVPEGWARTMTGSTVMFADKYNSITIDTESAAAAPTTATAQRTELATIRATTKGFGGGSVSSVRRKSGSAILITYNATSQPNAVTGKVAKEAVERYEFWRAGRELVLTLAAPVGSDNVDPWRTVTDSFTWGGS